MLSAFEILKKHTNLAKLDSKVKLEILEAMKEFGKELLKLAEDKITDLGLYDMYGSNGDSMSGEVSEEVDKIINNVS